jgi:hypothetical protein
MALAPRRVGDLGNEILKVPIVFAVAVIHRDWIVLVTEIAPVSEQVNGTRVSFSCLLKNTISNGVD